MFWPTKLGAPYAKAEGSSCRGGLYIRPNRASFGGSLSNTAAASGRIYNAPLREGRRFLLWGKISAGVG